MVNNMLSAAKHTPCRTGATSPLAGTTPIQNPLPHHRHESPRSTTSQKSRYLPQ